MLAVKGLFGQLGQNIEKDVSSSKLPEKCQECPKSAVEVWGG
jgi:hypothetical protein